MVLHHFLDSRLVLHPAVHFVGQALPAVLAKDLFQLFLGQFMVFDTLGQFAQIFLALALLLLPAQDDLLNGRLGNSFCRRSVSLVEDIYLTGQRAQFLRRTAKMAGVHDGDLLIQGTDLLLQLKLCLLHFLL